jgi:D-inositol-3-phosphate glycosyltransferase
LEDAIRALALITPQTPHTRLVIAGSPDPGTENYDRAMKRLARAQGVEERVVWAGHLGPADMAWCFRRAAAFIMTSRVEACPNTALEAMSEGALCLSTKNPPMPEFFGDAAAYYPAGDSAALARLLVDRALRATAGDVAASREAGRRRSRRYSWSDTAERTVGELLAAIG